MESPADGLFKKMVQLLELMRQTAASEPTNAKIAIELQKYERELYLNLRDYGGLLRNALNVDRVQAEEGLQREAEILRLRNELADDDEDLDWSMTPSRGTTLEMSPTPQGPSRQSPAGPPLVAPPPTGDFPARPLPPRGSEERAAPRPRSASEILSQLHGGQHPSASGEH